MQYIVSAMFLPKEFEISHYRMACLLNKSFLEDYLLDQPFGKVMPITIIIILLFFYHEKESKPKNSVRKHLGLARNMKTVLLMGGGDGVGGLGPIACQLSKKLNNLDISSGSQMIIICGHNKKMSDDLKSKLKDSNKLKVVIKGFVNNIDEFMSASDCLITKAGPGTIAEAMIRGLPLVLSYFLPGQVNNILINPITIVIFTTKYI